MSDVTVDPELARGLLDDALNNDASEDPPAAEPPPRVPWLNEDGTPRWGLKPDGTPRRAKPGSGRPPKDSADTPRTVDKLPGGGGAESSRTDNAEPAPAARDYTQDIGGALTTVWMGLAAVPWTRGHAAVLNAQIPALAHAGATAADHNAAVRRFVARYCGEGSLGWVIPVTVAVVPLAMGMFAVTVNGELRAQLAEQTKTDFQEFMVEQARLAGLLIEGEAEDVTAAQ